MMVAAILLLMLAPAPTVSPTSTPEANGSQSPSPLPRSCGTDGTKPKPSGTQYPESNSAACTLQREVRNMSKTLSDEPVDDMGARDMWDEINREQAEFDKDKSKKDAAKPKP